MIHCPFCHGWEVRTRGSDCWPQARSTPGTWSRCCAGCPPTSRPSTPSPHWARRMASCTGSSCPMGPRSPVTPSSSPPRPARDDAFAHLALERTGPDQLEIDPFGRTSVAGLNAAGDLVATAPAVVQALPPASARRSASHRTSRPGRGHDAARDRRRQQERTRQDANPVTFGFAGGGGRLVEARGGLRALPSGTQASGVAACYVPTRRRSDRHGACRRSVRAPEAAA